MTPPTDLTSLVDTIGGLIGSAAAGGWTTVGVISALIGVTAVLALFIFHNLNKQIDRRDTAAIENGAGAVAVSVKSQTAANKSALDRLEG